MGHWLYCLVPDGRSAQMSEMLSRSNSSPPEPPDPGQRRGGTEPPHRRRPYALPDSSLKRTEVEVYECKAFFAHLF